MKLLGFLFLCFRLCLSAELSDVTAIYHVAKNNNVDYVDIHLRTNALGLPIRIGQQLVGPEDYEFHLEPYNQWTIGNINNLWEQENWNLIGSKSSFIEDFSDDTVIFNGGNQGFSSYIPFKSTVHIKLAITGCKSFKLLLTPDEQPLEIQEVFYYIRVNNGPCGLAAIFQCNIGMSNSLVERITIDGQDRDCERILQDVSTFSWYIRQQNGTIQMWQDNIGLEPVLNWQSPITMKFLKMAADSNVHAKVASFVPLLQTSTSKAKITSPWFVPKYKSVCMVIVFYTDKYIQHPMHVYALDSSLKKIHLGLVGEGSKIGWQSARLITTWPENMNSKEVRLIIETSDIDTNVTVEVINSCNGEGVEDVIVLAMDKHVTFRDIGIPLLRTGDINEERFNLISDEALPVNTTRVQECWHNSVHFLDTCACPPGFSGNNCEQGCGKNRFGKDCKGKCSTQLTECSGLLLCTPLVGCLCPPGYKGDTCEDKCESGTYGNNCTETCGHCEDTCDIYTGECSSCQPGYQLPLCKRKYAFTLFAPDIDVTTFGEVTVKPILSDITGKANPEYYSIQYKKDFTSDSWISHSTHPIPPKYEGSQETVIKDLGNGIKYKVRTVLIDKDLNSYQGEDIPTTNFLSLCIIPENPDYHVKAYSNQTSFTVSWDYVIQDIHWCPVEKFEVSWKLGWKWITDFTTKTNITVHNQLPDTSFEFKIRSFTSRGIAPFSPTIVFSTKPNGVSERVRNLNVTTTSSKSAKINWNPPLDLETTQLTYIVKYKCLKQMACQKECNESSGELHVTNTSISLDFLYPFSQYLVTVSPEDGPSSNIVLGTKMTEPVEIPEPSSKPPITSNTTVTVYWNRPEVCSGILNNYIYQIFKAGDSQLVKTGSTVKTNATFDKLLVSTHYRVLVYAQTLFGDINPDKYLEINVSTSATVPDKVQDLTVYKRGRHLLGLRWASPNNTYGPIVSFTIKYGQQETALYKTVNIKPSPCVVWPELFCHTITRLQADIVYKISVSARNSEVDGDGAPTIVKGITKEKTPGPPENVKLLNVTSTSLVVQWDYPNMANGILRSFLLNVEETEQFDEEKCCQVYPIIETTVTDELEHYVSEVSGLHAASTYVVSVSGKTVSFGPSQTITVHTRPPPLPVGQLPNVVVNIHDALTWLPQQQNFINNSDLYRPLIKGSLLFVITNDTVFNNTGIKEKKLIDELRNLIPGNFYLAAEYTNAVSYIQLGKGEVMDSKWGEISNTPLQGNYSYQLAAVQVNEYCGVYSTDIVFSSVFQAF